MMIAIIVSIIPLAFKETNVLSFTLGNFRINPQYISSTILEHFLD